MGRRRPAAGMVLVVALLGVTVLAASYAGPWVVRFTPRVLPTDGATREPAPLPSLPSIPPEAADQPFTLDLSGAAWAGVVLGLVLLALMVRWVLAQERPELSFPDTAPEVAPLELEPSLATLEQGLAAAVQQLRGGGEPADAVVAAWVALEDAARRSGVPRDPAATPTEFVVEVLGRTTADRAATRSLLASYERARFSALPVSEADVDRAADDLRCISATLREVAR
ncbi:DUF4129 domain-containing protein [Isoptericola sp. b490]|uniref:DUF4129 domain-containing protein n=1 Tax=Actinotalea lenta TaxID=3064654 RepID=UPI002713614F|nr:DUF4129 domain-containing protein [Isoptericola sp. b490]MDO8122045.1 DUF4129 domain-containing protein [Isoptericola sp. b490]